jgi:hypothetical protein
MKREITDELVDAVKGFLGPPGIALFSFYKREHGTVSPVYMEDGFPHPVHFREGMHVRNYMRSTNLCENWSPHDLDDTWAEVVERAIK